MKHMVQPCFKIEKTIIALSLRRTWMKELILTLDKVHSFQGAIPILGLINYVFVWTNEKACNSRSWPKCITGEPLFMYGIEFHVNLLSS